MCFSNNNNYGSIKTILKGSQPSVFQIGEKTRLEFSICLKNKFFRVSSLPAYENVIELSDKSKINLEKEYCLAICIEGVNDFINIENVMEVSSFNGDIWNK